MPKMHLRQTKFTNSACGAFTKTRKEYKNVKKQRIHDIFIKTNMAWFMKILKIYLEEQLLMKYYLIKLLTLLKIQNIIDINVDLLQWISKRY